MLCVSLNKNSQKKVILRLKYVVGEPNESERNITYW